MKKVILALCVVLAGVCVYFIAQPSASEPAIESFRLVAWDNANDGTICQESGMVEVRHISSGKQVMNVDYILSPGSEITPDPKSLIEKWPEKVTFTVKNQGKTYDFNTADKLNTLLLNCLLSTGQLKGGVSEKLKATDMMSWVRQMNNIRSRVQETVLKQVVYA